MERGQTFSTTSERSTYLWGLRLGFANASAIAVGVGVAWRVGASVWLHWRYGGSCFIGIEHEY